MALNTRSRRKTPHQVKTEDDINEIKTYFSQCKCCLNYAYLKSMWAEHNNKGKKEVYGKMLVECFAIPWIIEEKVDEKICETCITKLRSAVTFKEIVMNSQKELRNKFKKAEIGASEIDKSSQFNIKVDKDYSSNEQVEDSEYYKDVQFLDEDMMEQVVMKTEDLETDVPKMDLLEIVETKVFGSETMTDDNYNEDDYDVGDQLNGTYEVKETKLKNEVLDKEPRTKTDVKGKRKSLRKYRQYTSDTLFNAMEAVKAEQLTPRQASMKFNIPRKTIYTKLSAEEKPVTLNALILARFFKDISAILKHTNATPFRSKGNNFYCLICQDENIYKDPVKLREHTHSVHKNEEIRIEFVMRPYYANEILKLDVKDLTCVICDTSVSWSEIIEHLEQHGVYLELAKTRVVPYELNINELTCVLCDHTSVFTLMDSHMNVHYNNYICGECGDTFISAARFNTHMRRHKTGIYPCSFCNKMFARELYRKKHIDVVHNKKSTFKCWYCTEKFVTESERRSHAEEHHSEKVLRQRNCKVCNKSLPSHLYSKHVKRCKGRIEQKCDEYKCDDCGKTFIRRKLLEEHMLRHTGVKNFQCDICMKSYFSLAAVSTHKKYKHNILRSMCEANDLIKHFKVNVHA